ncbi:MAG: hypothetical protein GEV28_33365 [Actinophytocola sp.]|nr:hypothetical protein [Actinophytocola sp.]
MPATPIPVDAACTISSDARVDAGNDAVGRVFPPAPAEAEADGAGAGEGSAGGTGSAGTVDAAADAASSAALTASRPLDGRTSLCRPRDPSPLCSVNHPVPRIGRPTSRCRDFLATRTHPSPGDYGE